MKSLLLIAALAIGSTSAFAASQKNYCGNEIAKQGCKNIPENRRNELGKLVGGGNPVAIANNDGNLYVYYTVGGNDLQKCQVASNVESFKMSQNPNDIAAAYFVTSDSRLFDLRMSGYVSKGSCPKADKKDMLEYTRAYGKLAKDGGDYAYKIVSNSNSRIVGIALSTNGTVVEWSDLEYSFARGVGKRAFEARFDALQGN